MASTPPLRRGSALPERLEEFGRRLGEREGEHRGALERARACAEALHQQVARGLDAFHGAAASGAPHLHIELGPVRLDEKHARAIQFDLRRGRYAAVVTVKSRGEVTLVGPFQMGKQEGPCRSFPMDAEDEVASALVEFLESFLEEAATP